MIIAKSYNRALKRFIGGFYGRMGAVVGRKYDEILNLWMRSPVKFIKFYGSEEEEYEILY